MKQKQWAFIFLSFFLTEPLFAWNSGSKILAEQNRSEYVIVRPEKENPIETFALQELQNGIRKLSGADLPAIRENSPDAGRKTKRIFLGIVPQGEKKEERRKSLETQSVQESVVLVKGDDLYLYGKGKYGTLYAVYDLLEQQYGIRWLSAWEDADVPKAKRLYLPEKTIMTRPAFPFRGLMTWFYADKDSASLFGYRNRQNMLLNTKNPGIRNLYEYFHTGNHTLFLYIPSGISTGIYPKPPEWVKNKNYFQTNPDFFSMDENGKRVPNRQLCFSNPELREELTKNALEHYRRMKIKSGTEGFLTIDCNDIAYNMCYCPECRKLQEKYQCEGAPLFDYLIEICRNHPEIQFNTLAYQRGQTQRAPSNIQKLPKNLNIIFAPINGDFASPLDSEKNRRDLDDLRNWCKLTPNVWVWYYPNPYLYNRKFFFPPPVGNLERIAKDIRLMWEAGALGSYFEHDSGGVKDGTNLSELQTWVMLRLFQTPDADLQHLIRDFTNRYYGPAAPQMRQYLSELEAERKKWIGQGNIWSYNTADYTYLKPKTLKHWSILFDQAEKAASGEQNFHVRIARLGLDSAIIGTMEHNEDLPLFKATASRMKNTIEELASKRKLWKDVKSEFQKWIAEKAARVPQKPLPEEFREIPKDQIRIITPLFEKLPSKTLALDPSANIGKAATELCDGKNFSVGTYDSITKKYGPGMTLSRNKILPGEYKLYGLNRPLKLTPNMILFGGKWMISIPIGTLCSADDPLSLQQDWDLYISLKFDGPAFRKNSPIKENRVYCDRAILVKRPAKENAKP